MQSSVIDIIEINFRTRDIISQSSSYIFTKINFDLKLTLKRKLMEVGELNMTRRHFCVEALQLT